MLFPKTHSILPAMLLAAAALVSCDAIDEDLTDCGQDVRLTYEMRLETNRDQEIADKLGEPGDLPVEQALRAALQDVFTDYAHDLHLSFFTPDSALTLGRREDMNATRASYTIYFDQGRYDHWAVVHLDREPLLELRGDAHCATGRLVQPLGDVVASQKVGVFSGRHQMDVVFGQNSDELIPLYQVNCAAALVVDTTGYDIRGIDAYVDDLAYSFHLRDSVYHYGDVQAVRAGRLDLAPYLGGGTSKLAALLAVAFPSQDKPVLPDGTVWRMRLYVALPDGTVTENVISVPERLRAGYLKILRLKMKEGGGVESVNAEASVSVTLNWKPGHTFTPDFY